MRTKAALPYVARQVAAFFIGAAVAGLYGEFSTSITPVGGNASFTAGGTEPASDYEVAITFVAGGTVGVSGIVYRATIDDGATTSAPIELGTASTIEVWNRNSGVTVLLGSGTIPTGQVLSFTTEGPRRSSPVLFGWKEYSKQINQGAGGASRVVFVPGQGPDKWSEGAFRGVLTAGPRDLIPPPPPGVDAPPGLRGRHLYDWNRAAFVSIWGVDRARPQDDAANYEACDRLLEDVMQGLQHTVAGLFKLGTPEWTTPLEQQFGRHIVLPMTFRATVFDIPAHTVSPTPIVNRNPPT